MRLAITLFASVIMEVASAAELGSMERPVRAFMPSGEREYIMRLRCPNHDEPLFERAGSFGSGPYGNILDGYKVTCGDAETMVFIDMYHRDYRETEAVPGFTLLREIPAKVAEGCPPQVPGHKPGSYIFRPLEVSEMPFAETDIELPVKIGTEGRAYTKFTIDENGAVIPNSVDVVYVSTESLRAPTAKLLLGLKFHPALHHEGCAVPFAAELGIDYE